MARLRPCIDCSRPTEGTRCPACRQGKERARGTTTARGYGASHQAERRQWEPQVAAGTVLCRRCRELIHPDEPWHLGHPDAECTAPTAPEHAGRCNVAAANRLR